MSRPGLDGLRTLVTGASSGIGAALSTLLAARGCRVVGTGRSRSGLAQGNFVSTIACDLTVPGAPARVVTEAAEALGGLDLVVSNAGAGWAGPFGSMSEDELDALLDVNLRVPLHLARAAGPALRAARGRLVLVGSIAGSVGVPREVAYSAAKAGLRGMADSLRAEWPEVTVTLVSPGAVSTPFFERRNRPYDRTWPRPVPVAKVAMATVRAIEDRRPEVIVPSWLALAARLNGGLPVAYRALAELAERATRRQ